MVRPFVYTYVQFIDNYNIKRNLLYITINVLTSWNYIGYKTKLKDILLQFLKKLISYLRNSQSDNAINLKK